MYAYRNIYLIYTDVYMHIHTCVYMNVCMYLSVFFGVCVNACVNMFFLFFFQHVFFGVCVNACVNIGEPVHLRPGAEVRRIVPDKGSFVTCILLPTYI